MLKLLKHLKPYTALAIICLVLVFFRAMGDLRLPDYMSDIVNVGIQQNGVEDALADSMRTETFDILLKFMTEEEQALAAEYYTESDGMVHLSEQPTGEQYDILDNALSRGFFALAASQSGMMPESEGLVQALPTLDSATLSAMITQIDEAMAQQGEDTVGSIVALAVSSEYQAAGVDVSGIQQNYILKTGALMLAIALAIAALTVCTSYIASRISAAFARDIRGKVFEKTMSFSGAEMNSFSTASLITRTTNDITQVQQVVLMMFRIILYAPILGIGGIIYAVDKSVSMSWIIALAVIVLLGFIAMLFLLAMPRFKRLQKLIDRLNLVSRETLSGIMVSRAYNTQDFEKQRFDTANKDVAKTTLFVNRLMQVLMPVMQFIMYGMTLLIVWFGAEQISQSALQIGDMMAYIQYAMQVVMAFMMISMIFIMVPRASVSAERILKVLNSETLIDDPEKPETPDSGSEAMGTVEFRDVGFSYPGSDEQSLSGISFIAKPGEMTAIIGSTGSGKSTLLNLIPRFFDAQQGQILVDGIDVRQRTLHELRGRIGLVPQKAVLFSDTLTENLRLGAPDATDEQLRTHATTAQAIDFIESGEDGWQRKIAQGGTNVSGGQRQRLCIARALATEAQILLFDDSFSALDFKTDRALRSALTQQAADATLIVVAQRVSTIKNAARIIVLDDGRMVGLGTHDELMKNCTVYNEIAMSQMRKEEMQ